ncbi:MAG: addiction module protein [Planctomycetes bacterium]|nr:addiction module protein [Planctomycetota bacterium]
MATALTQKQVAKLSVEDRLRLLELVWDSLDAEDAPAPDWHEDVIDQRLKRMKEQPGQSVPWPEARKQLRKRRKPNGKR